MKFDKLKNKLGIKSQKPKNIPAPDAQELLKPSEIKEEKPKYTADRRRNVFSDLYHKKRS